ncbi:MAG: helix-turn-helix transcriptional regulator [Planctomycetaceae bacterium]
MTSEIQTVTLGGKRFVILSEVEYRRLAGEPSEPARPRKDAAGNYPAVEALRSMLGRKLIRRRRAAGLTQAELARRAGIRAETLNRIERGTNSPSVATVEKLDRALREAADEVQ